MTSPKPLHHLEYDYDLTANITGIEDYTTAGGHELQSFGYDSLSRLTSASASGGPAPYTESYAYDAATGNLAVKNGLTYAYDPSHPHAVSSLGGNTYSYDANGNQVTRNVNGQSFTLGYDAEGHLAQVTGPSYSAVFTFDGDGKRVKSEINGETILFVGGHYEVKAPGAGQQVTKYYFAGAARCVMP